MAVIPRQISEAQKAAMQRGRQKVAKAKRKEAVARVKAFREWMDADFIYSQQLRAFIDTEGQSKVTVKKPKPPATGLPSDNDYQIAREEGLL